jgi:hypothetical protein
VAIRRSKSAAGAAGEVERISSHFDRRQAGFRVKLGICK